MAESIIPQTEPFCKVQSNPKTTALARVYAKSDKLCLRECAKVATMDNDRAVEFLRSIGFSQIVPGTHFAPMYDYTKFFGVKEDSFYGYMQRYGFNHSDNPRESFSSDLASFFRKAGLLKYGNFVRGDLMRPGGLFDFYFKSTDTHYITEYRWSTRFYSARCALAILPLICGNGRAKHEEDAKYMVIYRKLMAYIGALEAEAQKNDRVVTKSGTARPEPSSATLSKDELMSMIKQAVREVLADARVEVPTTFTITT